MIRPWLAEYRIDAALVSALYRECLPEGAEQPPTRMGAGWDSEVWCVGDLALRFPRRALGAQLLAVEQEVLPGLARHVSLQIPVPEVMGRPTPLFPHPYYGYRFVPGVTACQLDLDDDARRALAPALGEFLRSLHALPPHAFGAPLDSFRGDTARVAGRAAERVELLPDGVSRDAILRRLTSPPLPALDGPVLLHGDLYSRHLLLDEAGKLTGVIDWGDVCVGDRAVDLRVAHAFLPPSAHAAFLEAYGPVSDVTWERARFLAFASYGVSVLVYATDVHDDALLREARRTLAWTLEAPEDAGVRATP